MVVSITGKPGSGKTTLLKKIIGHFENRIGFLTEEVRVGGKRVGFDAVSSWGERVVLARKGLRSRWMVGRYGVDAETFERKIVIPLRKRFRDFELVYIDEVGKMECFSKEFISLVRELLGFDGIVIFTIPFRDFNDTIALVRRRSTLIFETPSWREKVDEILKEIHGR